MNKPKNISVGHTEPWNHEFATSKGYTHREKAELPVGCLGYFTVF